MTTSKPFTVAEPAGRDEQRGEHLGGGRLARAVGTEQTEQFAFLDVKRDILHCDDLTVVRLMTPMCDLNVRRRWETSMVFMLLYVIARQVFARSNLLLDDGQAVFGIFGMMKEEFYSIKRTPGDARFPRSTSLRGYSRRTSLRGTSQSLRGYSSRVTEYSRHVIASRAASRSNSEVQIVIGSIILQ